jgi:hypothetical protein
LNDISAANKITVRDLRDCIGHLAFAPMLLLASLLGLRRSAAFLGCRLRWPLS